MRSENYILNCSDKFNFKLVDTLITNKRFTFMSKESNCSAKLVNFVMHTQGMIELCLVHNL